MFCITIPQRWIFAFLCFLGTMHTYALRTCLSITLTEMVIPTAVDVSQDDSCTSGIFAERNSTTNTYVNLKNRFEWNEYNQGLILSSFYYSYVITHIPGGQLAKKFGGKHIVGAGVFLSAFLTILIPLSIKIGNSTGLMIIRILMGLCQGVIYPAIGAMVPNWTPFEERSRIGTLIYSGEPLGIIYANMVGGLILYYLEDWRYVFYLIGGTGVLWYGLWLGLCYDSPKDHPFVSDSERDYLEEKLNEHVQEDSKNIPWKHILRSVPVWAAILALMGFDYSLITVITYMPKYLGSVLKFSVDQNGYLNSLICICMWAGSAITSWASDFVVSKTKVISATKARKVGSVIALFCSASFFVGASYAGCDRILVMIVFGVAMTLMGAGYPCILINALDLSPNYAGILMALSNGISVSFNGIMAPYVIGSLTPNQTLSEWRLVFWIFFAVSFSTNIVFLLFGSADVQYWNNVEKHSQNYQKNLTNTSYSADVVDNTESTRNIPNQNLSIQSDFAIRN